MATPAPEFTILNRDENGKFCYQYPEFHMAYRAVSQCIALCRKMLAHPRIQRVFIDLAEEFDIEVSKKREDIPWYKSGQDAHLPVNMEPGTKSFFAMIYDQFPVVIVDYTIGQPECTGDHIRRAWHPGFTTSNQYIRLNGHVSATSFAY